MHHNPNRRCVQLDVCCAVGPTQPPWSKAHLAAVIGGDASLAILSNADTVPAYLRESLLADQPSLTGPPCPLNDRSSQVSRQPSMVAENSRRFDDGRGNGGVVEDVAPLGEDRVGGDDGAVM